MAFVPENPSTLDEVKTFSDEGLTTLVEDLTSSAVNVDTGEFLTDELDHTLYSLGSVYWVKITWTPAGSPQQTDSWPFMVRRIAQPSGTAPASGTDCEGSYIQTPRISLRLGRNGFGEDDLEDATYGTYERYAQQIPPPENREAEDVHLVFSSARAGAPMFIEFINIHGESRPIFGAPDSVEPPSNVRPAPAAGYRGRILSAEHLLRRSRNISIDGDLAGSRRGYAIDKIVDPSVADPTYVEKLPCSPITGLGTVNAYQVGNKFFDDDTPPSTLPESPGESPYDGPLMSMPRSVLIRGVRLWCNKVEHFTLTESGGLAVSLRPLGNPVDPVIAPIAGGTLPDGDRYVRIRWRDSSTDTKSGPNSIFASVAPVALASPNNAVQIDLGGAPDPRATEWQIQSAPLDTPDSYEIHYDPKDGVGGAVVSDSSGWIPVATTTAFIDAPAGTADFFEFRKSGGFASFRHATPPTGADHVAHYKGHAFYASSDGTWLVWSDSDNPEHHYADPANPYVGFNTVRGEDLVDTVISPCRCLAAVEDQLLFFTESQVVVFQGSMQISLDPNSGEFAGRDFRPAPIGENSLGAGSPAWTAKDQDIYFWSQAGPAIYRAGQTGLLDPDAVEGDWDCRDRIYERRSVVGYDARTRLLFFSFVTNSALMAGVPDVTLAFDTEKGAWCAPFDLPACSWALARWLDGGDPAGTHLFFGNPYGVACRYGVGTGDGQDGSSTAAVDLVSTASTPESVTVAGQTWTTDEHKACGLTLTDRQTGRRYYVVIKSNTSDVLTWVGPIDHSGAGWIVNIGAFPSTVHTAVSSPGAPFRLDSCRVIIQDQLSG